MTLYLIGTGLHNAKDLTIKAKEILQTCDKIYLESYTSILQENKETLEKEWNIPIREVERPFVEGLAFLDEAKDKDIALLIIGDVFAATTHATIFLEAKKRNINIEIINNASILTAVGITGLELYKFGQTTSIPFQNEHITTPIDVYKKNQSIGVHTLFLLDLHPKENQFLTINNAASYLIKKGVQKETAAIACANIGSKNPVIKPGTLHTLQKERIKELPQCLIIPGNLHFIEEEMLKMWEQKKK